jgi:hypothetical protein
MSVSLSVSFKIIYKNAGVMQHYGKGSNKAECIFKNMRIAKQIIMHDSFVL